MIGMQTQLILLLIIALDTLENSGTEANLTEDVFSETGENNKSRLWVFMFDDQIHEKPTGESNFNALVLLLCIWIFLITMLLITYNFFRESFSKLPQIDDGVIKKSEYKYVIVIKPSSHSKQYSLNQSYLLLDLLDNQKLFIARIAIPPRLLNVEGTLMKTVKFIFNRDKPMDIKFVRVSHDCWHRENPSINILSVTVKDLWKKAITNIKVFSAIRFLLPNSNANEQVFPADVPFTVNDDEDFHETEIPFFITFFEYTLFFNFYVNLVSLLVLIVPKPFQLRNVWNALGNAIVSSLIALVVTLMLTVIYGQIIKRKYALVNGNAPWVAVKWSFIGCMCAVSITFSVTAYFIARLFSTEFIVRWFLAIVFSVLISLLLFMAFILFDIAILRREYKMDIQILETKKLDSEKVERKGVSSKVGSKTLRNKKSKEEDLESEKSE